MGSRAFPVHLYIRRYHKAGGNIMRHYEVKARIWIYFTQILHGHTSPKYCTTADIFAGASLCGWSIAKIDLTRPRPI